MDRIVLHIHVMSIVQAMTTENMAFKCQKFIKIKRNVRITRRFDLFIDLSKRT